MKTANAVADGRITNEGLGGIHRKTWELARRIEEGTIDYNWVMDRLQTIVEGFKLPQDAEMLSIYLGRFKSVDEILTSINPTGSDVFNTHAQVRAVLSSPGFSLGKSGLIRLVFLTPAQLGFRSATQFDDVYERAIALGLELCPSEVGPALTCQMNPNHFAKITTGECSERHLFVAMSGIRYSANRDTRKGSIETELAFRIGCDEGVSKLILATHPIVRQMFATVKLHQVFAFVLPDGSKLKKY